MKTFFPKAASLLAALFLIACTGPNPQFSDMANTYQAETEKFQNNNILLNIVRASSSMPLSFLDIPSIIGTGSLTETAGLAGYIYSAGAGTLGGFFSAAGTGTMGSYYNPSVTLSASRSFNFTLSSLTNAPFQKGFLSQITPETIHFFNSSDINNELIYMLMISQLEFTTPKGKRVMVANNPLSPTFSEFQYQLRLLIDGGLTTELVMQSKPIGPPLTKAQVTDKNNLVEYTKLQDKQIMLQPIQGKDGQNLFQLVQMVQTARFCFNPHVNKDLVLSVFGSEMLCADPLSGVKPNPANAKHSISSSQAKNPLQIKLRSTKDIFEYMGNVLVAQSDSKSNTVYLKKRSPSDRTYSLVDIKDQLPLFVAVRNNDVARPVALVSYEGSSYAVSREDSGYSIYVLNILSQLVNLLKVPGSIPASPAVLIK
jgi:hypothetical protein